MYSTPYLSGVTVVRNDTLSPPERIVGLSDQIRQEKKVNFGINLLARSENEACSTGAESAYVYIH